MEKGLSREDMLVLELINGVFDEKLRGELIRRSGETNYEGLVKVAQNWHTSEITRAGLASDETDEAARKAASTYSERKADEWNKRNEVQNPANQQRNAAPGDNNRPLCRNCKNRHPRARSKNATHAVK